MEESMCYENKRLARMKKAYFMLKGDVLFRYLDLPKFINILTSRTLFFTNVTTYRDKEEGVSIKKSDLEGTFIKKILFQKSGLDFNNDTLIKKYEQEIKLRNRYYVSCWTRDCVENSLLWNTYCHSGYGVAIKTNINQLVKSYSEDVFSPFVQSSDVEYKANQDKEACFIKNDYYSSEKEFRLAVDICELLPKDKGLVEQILRDEYKENGFRVKVNLEILIGGIYCWPHNSWYISSIKEFIKSIYPGLENKVSVSKFCE